MADVHVEAHADRVGGHQLGHLRGGGERLLLARDDDRGRPIGAPVGAERAAVLVDSWHVFRGTDTLAAVAATHGLNDATVAYLVSALVDKSIVSVSFPDGDHFDPEAWKSRVPNAAYIRAQPDDTFWAADRDPIAAFCERHVDARLQFVTPVAPCIRREIGGRRFGKLQLEPLDPGAGQRAAVPVEDGLGADVGLQAPARPAPAGAKAR